MPRCHDYKIDLWQHSRHSNWSFKHSCGSVSYIGQTSLLPSHRSSIKVWNDIGYIDNQYWRWVHGIPPYFKLFPFPTTSTCSLSKWVCKLYLWLPTQVEARSGDLFTQSDWSVTLEWSSRCLHGLPGHHTMSEIKPIKYHLRQWSTSQWVFMFSTGLHQWFLKARRVQITRIFQRRNLGGPFTKIGFLSLKLSSSLKASYHVLPNSIRNIAPQFWYKVRKI